MKILLFVIGFLFFLISGSLAQWQKEIQLTNSSGYPYKSPKVTTGGIYVHVVWTDYSNKKNEDHSIYYKRSTDEGTSWQKEINMANDKVFSGESSIAVSGAVVHIVWSEKINEKKRRVNYIRSTDNGNKWGIITKLTDNNAGSEEASISVYGPNVHIVWVDERDKNEEIYYKKSTDNGVSWGKDTRLTDNADLSESPSVIVYDKIVFVIWHDYRFEKFKTYYKRSTDGGLSWEAETNLNNWWLPSAGINLQTVHLVYYNDPGGKIDLYYRRSTNGGSDWQELIPLMTKNSGINFEPVLSVFGSNVYIVWEDFPALSSHSRVIYFKCSTDEGNSWEQEISLTSDTILSYLPSVSASDKYIHVVYESMRKDSNWDLFYKRRTAGK